MTAGTCTFTIEVRRNGGAIAGTSAASLSNCIDDALLHGVRTGRLPNDGMLPALHLEPTWHETQRPAVIGLRLAMQGLASRFYDREAFAAQARGLIQRLLREGVLANGERVTWSLVARDHEAAPAPAALVGREPFQIHRATLPHVAPGAYEICLDVRALRQIRDRVRADGTIEGAEMLLGQLRHDPERRALELSIIDALPLAPGRGGRSNTHFSFEPRSLLEAKRLAAERDDGARPCGWHHNHNPCAECPRRPDCDVDWVFCSADDVEVHSSLFSSPEMVALVGGKLGHLPASRPGFRMYGWRDARMLERTFRVEGPGAAAWSANQSTFIDDCEESSCTKTSPA